MNLIFSPQNLEIFSQLLIAAVLGILIGTEREIKGRLAGVKTHALVSLGSCLFTILSTIGFNRFVVGTGFNPAHVAANIVVGIGFLGAGLIIFHESKIQGLTTAAGIWTTAGIGMAIGLKFYFAAFFVTFLVLLIYTFLYYFELYLHRVWDKKDKTL
jgi:putative Mg2+ transporter-C (MgtC) family protein